MTHALSTAELQEIYTFALDLGRRAGKILLDGVDARCGAVSGRETGPAEEKMNAVDIVTQTDLGTSRLSSIEQKQYYSRGINRCGSFCKR
jgi:myo-inositol-1(or 4)-monophosphatase